MLDISAKRVESLAEADWEENDRNAIVARIARMTITTMSSTRVKATCFLFFINMRLRIWKFEFLVFEASHRKPLSSIICIKRFNLSACYIYSIGSISASS
jgi:hypothetical protein